MCVPQLRQYHRLPSKRSELLDRPHHVSIGIRGQE